MSKDEARIDYDSRGDLDDIAIQEVTMFRMERMGTGRFWVRCYRNGKPDIVIYLTSARKIIGSHEIEN